MHRPSSSRRAFTLIELLVVISVIAILIGLLFPAFRGVQDQAKRTQAKNDVTQLVTAVNAFYTEYGRYPVTSATNNDAYYGSGTAPTGATSIGANDLLLNELRGCTTTTGSCSNTAAINTRQIVFISPPDAKDANTPRAGIAPSGSTKGQYFDPWGRTYNVEIDYDYNNQLTNPYGASGGAGASPLAQGVIAWGFGSDGVLGSAQGNGGDGVYKNTTTGIQSDDVISWQ